MNKAAIKNFAIWARTKLIEDIKYKAGMIGISATGIAQPLPQSTRDLQFFDIGTKDYAQVAGREIAQRDKLILAIREKERTSDYQTAFRYVIEEVAYTWFNRLIAVRFMEVNDYLPSRVRVLSSENPNKTEPDFVTNPFDTDLSFTSEEQDLVLRLKDENRLDELFGMLFIKQCNKLYEILPNLFEETADYTELLLTLSFTDKDGVVYHLVHDIPEDDFNISVGGQVEIIGWLYQYYNTEQNELVYDGNMSKSRIPKELLPAATTIYTPDWAVRYMVENSLGRLWTEGHPNDDLKSNWKYYLEEAEQEPHVQAQLAEIRKEYATLAPEDIKLIDPCMGSGHILVYAFDVLMQIYVANGYLERDAAHSILQNNLYGLDIDDRAAQLAYFAVMMKARQYDRRIFSREITPHVFALQDSPVKGQEFYALLQNKPAAKRLMQSFHEAKEYGSIIEPNVTLQELDALTEELNSLETRLDSVDFVEEAEIKTLLATLRPMLEQGYALKQKYDVTITNPPYLSSNRFSPALDKYIKDCYPDEKNDLSAVMYRHAIETFSKENSFVSFITTTSWMFLLSFEKLRKYASNTMTITSLVDFGTELFDGKVGHNPIVSWVARKSRLKYSMTAIRLVDYCYSRRDEKEPEYFNMANRYIAQQENFSKIPGEPIVYWLSQRLINIFLNPSIDTIAFSDGQILTGDNDKYLRMLWEVERNCIEDRSRWVLHAKGGEQRRWYGNIDTVVNFTDQAVEHYKKDKIARFPKDHILFREGITWSLISSSDQFSMRLLQDSVTFNKAAATILFDDTTQLRYILGFLNTIVARTLLTTLNPTLNTNIKDVLALPLCFDKERQLIIEKIVNENITIAKIDWDSFETSWDFQIHPLVTSAGKGFVAQAFEKWQSDCESRFQQLKANEEDLNRIFIDIYGLQDELTPDVEEKDVTVRRADLSRDIRSLISYAVGCMFGRYSLDVPGLAFAGGTWDSSKYSSFFPDRDNCIPITDEEYFEDDIVGRFVNFIRTVYGAETLEENLDFIAKVLGNKGDTSRQVIRNYFLNDFMKDHMKIYQKRPIYWQFDSGKQNGFKALVYMHRWNADTVGNLRVEYLHRMQRVYEKEMERMQETIDNSSNAREVAAARKRKEKLTKQLKEAKDYDAKIAHIALSRIEIDLDDGVNPALKPISCATVHQFQGSEKDAIIYDAVDCYRMQYPGILLSSTTNNYANRLFNVAVTRAKGKFIGVGNIDYMVAKKLSPKLMFEKLIAAQRSNVECLYGQRLLSHSGSMDNTLLHFFDSRSGIRQYLKDIEAAKREVRIDIPDQAAANESIELLAAALNKAKRGGVKVYIRAENKATLPVQLLSFAIENTFVSNPVSVIDKEVVWFGMPESNAQFRTEGKLLPTTYRPIIRFKGKYTAASLYGFLEMSKTSDHSRTVIKDSSGKALTDSFSSYVLAHKTCNVCGKPMTLQKSKNGKFYLGCSAYPGCKNTSLVDVDLVDEYLYRNNRTAQRCFSCNCSLEAKIGRFGCYVQCCGLKVHTFKLDEI